MARENDNNVEVIDPKDRRYKDDNYFNGNDRNERNNYSIRYHYGCGCPFGLSSIIISILLSIIFTFYSIGCFKVKVRLET